MNIFLYVVIISLLQREFVYWGAEHSDIQKKNLVIIALAFALKVLKSGGVQAVLEMEMAEFMVVGSGSTSLNTAMQWENRFGQRV